MHDENEETEIDLDDILEVDALSPSEASSIARDLTVAWIQNNKYEDNLTEDEVSSFFKTLYHAVRFPSIWDGDDVDDEDEEDRGEAEGNGALNHTEE